MPEASGLVVYDDRFLHHGVEGHPERPDRLRAITQRLRDDPRLAGLTWTGAGAIDPAVLEFAHSPRLVEEVAALAAAGGGWLDADTYCTDRSYDVALRAAGGTVAAAEQVVTGAAPWAFALVRPPGHHATAVAPMGFCLFNNVAVAARVLQRQHGVARIAILDIDVHHGNGTEEIFWDDPGVLYCSLHEYPFYPGTGRASDRGGAAVRNVVNVPLDAATDGAEWLRRFDAEVLPAVDAFAPEVVMVSAGFDAHAADPLADLRLEDATYGAIAERVGSLAARHSDGRALWVLEGGYDLEALAASAHAVVSTCARS